MAKRQNEKGEDNDRFGSVNRRSYLQLAGAAVGTLATANTVTGTASAKEPTVDISDGDDIAPILNSISDGETVVLPQGTYDLRGDVSVNADNWTFNGNGSVVRTYETYGHRVKLNGSGYEFSHVGFEPQNQNDDQVWLTLWPYGADWHVHHLAWLSEKRVHSDDLGSSIRPGVNSGSEGNLTDIWFGAGVGHMDGNSHLHCFGSVDDDLWVRRTYFYQGGTYAANSSKTKVRNEGTTHFEDCYFENCYNQCARTGGHYQDTYIRRCVMHCSDRDDIPTKPSLSDSYFRGVWAWHGPVILEDVHINGAADRALAVTDRDIVQSAHIDYRSGEFTGRIQDPDKVQIDSSVGSNPSTSPPSNCVTTPEEAYIGTSDTTTNGGNTTTDGGSTTDTSANYDHTIGIQGTGTAANYEFTVDKQLAGGDDLEQWDSIDGTTTAGWVTDSSHIDTYQFNGSISNFVVHEGEVTVTLDGEEVDPVVLGNPNSRVLEVQGKGSPSNYGLAVSDTLEPGQINDLEQWDSIDGSTAMGWVTSTAHVDTYKFTGEVTNFAVLEGSVTVRVDGQEVDPSGLGSQ